MPALRAPAAAVEDIELALQLLAIDHGTEAPICESGVSDPVADTTTCCEMAPIGSVISVFAVPVARTINDAVFLRPET